MWRFLPNAISDRLARIIPQGSNLVEVSHGRPTTVEDDGTEWAAVRPGRVVKLSFPPPDRGSALEALALLVREEPDSA